MSNILEALRKAQNEKKQVPDQSVTGREALIAHRTARRWAGGNRRVIVLACSGALLLIIVAWVLYAPSKTSVLKSADNRITPEPQQSSISPPQQALPPLPQPAPAVVIPVAPTPPAAPQAGITPIQPGNKDLAGATHHNRNRRKPGAPLSTDNTPPSGTASTAPHTERPAETTVIGTPEGIKLAGIAWQDSRKLRRAVVNDSLVGEGTVVAGAKVLEIKPTMVKFEKNGTIFEASLSR